MQACADQQERNQRVERLPPIVPGHVEAAEAAGEDLDQQVIPIERFERFFAQAHDHRVQQPANVIEVAVVDAAPLVDPCVQGIERRRRGPVQVTHEPRLEHPVGRELGLAVIVRAFLETPVHQELEIAPHALELGLAHAPVDEESADLGDPLVEHEGIDVRRLAVEELDVFERLAESALGDRLLDLHIAVGTSWSWAPPLRTRRSRTLLYSVTDMCSPAVKRAGSEA